MLLIMISDALALIEFLRKHYEEWKVLSILFDWKGKRIEGDSELRVEITPDPKRKDVWFYHSTALNNVHRLKISSKKPTTTIWARLLPTHPV